MKRESKNKAVEESNGGVKEDEADGACPSVLRVLCFDLFRVLIRNYKH